MLHQRPTHTPIELREGLYSEDILFKDLSKFWQFVGSLQYLTTTRPDLAYSVKKSSQFMQALKILHWTALKRTLCYVLATLFYGVHIQKASTLDLMDFPMLIGGETGMNVLV